MMIFEVIHNLLVNY